jgi:anti-sigma factor ChrR (cupin superfamily)
MTAKLAKWFGGMAVVSACVWVNAQQGPSNRVELKRANLAVSDSMEVITAVLEIKPGEELPRHTHHGIETGYVLEGASIQPPGKDPMPFPTGAAFIFERDVPHGGFKVVGE